MRRIRMGVLVLGVVLVLSGCGTGGSGGSGDSGGGGGTGPPEGWEETLMALIAVPRTVIESEEDNPADDAYPTGMSLSGSPETSLSASLDGCSPWPDIPVCLTGTIVLTGTDRGTSFAITMVGTVSFMHGPYGSGEIDAEVVFPSDGGSGPDVEAEPLEVNGTVSLDGESWPFAEAIDAIESYTAARGIGDLTYPYRAHFFGAGAATPVDGELRGTLRYSRSGEQWSTLHVSGAVEFFGIAASPSGAMVAVGADRWWGVPDGKGYIYYSERGDRWELVETTADGEGLLRVAYGDGYWVAVGNGGALYYSTDGQSWHPTNSGTAGLLRAVAYGGGSWTIVGSNGYWKQSGDPTNWPLITPQDVAQGMTGIVAGLVFDTGTSEWIAAASDDGIAQLYTLDGGSESVAVMSSFSEDLDGQNNGEVWTASSYEESNAFYHFVLGNLDGNGRMFRHVTEGIWAAYSFTTTAGAPLVGVARGVYDSSEPARCLLASGGGDAWISDDEGLSWSQVLTDSYSVGAVTYRDW